MNSDKKDNLNIYKWLALISLTLIPFAAGIGILFDLNSDPMQLLIMAAGFLSLSWINWSRYKEKGK
ncbi:hypothetical protein [Bacillus thermotolerans]|uniref:Uncharacterized protein n=1 Tax=Bacillus thermotolerans TaxID=1221996 RepID=A0A0F5HTC7_BACTR|nr:hypothetical protein [Bacillus thermotolerans]KKB35578.1 hypothetical protein QY95_03431 [Bacillus thermotolerans]KKB36102.1 hypothetical protein QY97_01370 [Bacillus thermotolerans]